MSRQALRIQVAGLLAAALLSAGAGFAQTTIFTDNFNVGASPDWNNLRGDWIATNGVYYAQVPSNNPLTYTAIPFNLADCSIDVDINAVADGGVWMHSDETGDNGILLVTGGNGWGLGDRGGDAGTSMYWHVVVGGNYSSPINEAYNVITNPGVENIHLRVQVVGNVYSAYINGNTNPVTTLIDSTYASGRIGLYDFSTQSFDNVNIQVPASEAGPFSLQIANSVSNQAAIGWSTNANGWFLQSTPALANPTWTLVTNRPALSNQQYVVTVSATNLAQFFRLSLQ